MFYFFFTQRAAVVARRKSTWKRAFSCNGGRDFPALGCGASSIHASNPACLFASAFLELQCAQLQHLSSRLMQSMSTLASAGASSRLVRDDKIKVLSTGHDMSHELQESSHNRTMSSSKTTRPEEALGRELMLAMGAKNHNLIEDMLSRLRKSSHSLEASVFKEVIKHCKFKPGNSRMAEEVMKMMESRGVKLTQEVFYSYLLSLCRDHRLQHAFDLLEDAAKKAKEDPSQSARKPTTAMANNILQCAVILPNFKLAYAILQFMEDYGLKPNTRTRVCTMKFAGADKDRANVRRKWLEVMDEFGSQPPVPLYSARVDALANTGAVWEARLALEEMKDACARETSAGGSGCSQLPDSDDVDDLDEAEGMARGDADRPGQSVWSVSGDLERAYHQVLKAAVTAGESRLVELLLHERKLLDLKPYTSEREYNMRLMAAMNAGSMNEVKRLVDLMRKKNLAIEPASCAAWVQACSQKRDLRSTLRLFFDTLAKGIVCKESFHAAMYACFRAGNHDAAYKVVCALHTLKSKRTDLLAAACFIAAGMKLPLERMSDVKRQARINSIRYRMMDEHTLHSPTSLHAQIWAVGQAGCFDNLLDDMWRFRHRRDRYRCPLVNVLIYNTAIQACRRHGKMEEMLQLMDMMRQDGHPRDVFAERTLIGQVTYKDADLDSARATLEALRLSGHTPELLVYNFLIQVVSHTGDLNSALNLMSIMEEQSIRPDRQTFRTLVFYAAHHRQVDIMQDMVQEMGWEGYTLDGDMSLAVIAAYVRAGKHKDALQVVELLATQRGTAPEALAPDQAAKDGNTAAPMRVSDPRSPGAEVPLILDLDQLRALIGSDSLNERAAEIQRRVVSTSQAIASG